MRRTRALCAGRAPRASRVAGTARGLACTAGAVLACGGAARAATVASAPAVDQLLPQILILFGCFFLLAAAVGVLRFPDFYTRLHASTKLVTLGGIGIFGGAAIAFAPADGAGRVVLIASFFLLTAPISGYMIARSGYLRGLPPHREETSVDEWNACGAAVEDLEGERGG